MLKVPFAALILLLMPRAAVAQTAEESVGFIFFGVEDNTTAALFGTVSCSPWKRLSPSPLRLEAKACFGTDPDWIEVTRGADPCKYEVSIQRATGLSERITTRITLDLSKARYNLKSLDTKSFSIEAPDLACVEQQRIKAGRAENKNSCLSDFQLFFRDEILKRMPGSVDHFRATFCKGQSD